MASWNMSSIPNHCSRVLPDAQGVGSKAISMRGVPDATRDMQVFWGDRFYQFVLGISTNLVLGLTKRPNWEAIIVLAVSRIRTMHRLCILANTGYARFRSYAGAIFGRRF
jgi:hypothetical protein